MATDKILYPFSFSENPSRFSCLVFRDISFYGIRQALYFQDDWDAEAPFSGWAAEGIRWEEIFAARPDVQIAVFVSCLC